jgi:hypothetical protein
VAGNTVGWIDALSLWVQLGCRLIWSDAGTLEISSKLGYQDAGNVGSIPTAPRSGKSTPVNFAGWLSMPLLVIAVWVVGISILSAMLEDRTKPAGWVVLTMVLVTTNTVLAEVALGVNVL